MSLVHRDTLIQQLLDLGIHPGGVLLVHNSFSKVQPVEGGPIGLISALHAALGSDGTLVMPSMSYDDDHPFDKTTSHCIEMGIVAEKVTAPHPIDIPHGLDSPVGRVYELDGQVLLLGVDHTSNTTIHLAESLAGVRYRRNKYITILKNGKPTRCDYREIDHCCENFSLVDEWLNEKGLQLHGKVGNPEARLLHSRDIVKVVTGHLREDEMTFLHPQGYDEQCDDARASLPH